VEEQLALAIAKKMPTPFGSVFGNLLEQVEKKALRTAPPTSDIHLLDAFVFNPTGDILAAALRDKLLTIAKACVQRRCLHITYRRLFKVEQSDRVIEPSYIFCSTDGFWYVNAFCHIANAWRTFAIDQILEAILLEESSENKLPLDKESDIAAGFGAFHNGELEKVVVRFSPLIRPYIERRKWHRSETKHEVDDPVFGKGSLELRLRTTGLEGVKHWLKLWIPDFRVIEPVALSDELFEEMEKQAKYLKGSRMD
jgi:predicted DNA-binding transcriptional regulator YafY